jgi:thymidylate kinase
MIIIFDGTDKAGKTTLMYALAKATNYEHINIDRGPNSFIAYDHIYGRPYELDHLKTEMDLRNTSHLCVYCYADESDIKRRLKEAGETWPNEQGTISEVKKTFNESMLMSNLNTIYINTSELGIDIAVRKIRQAIEARKYDFIKLKVKKSEKGYIEYYPSNNTFSERLLETLPAFDKSVDEPYYNMLDSSLIHIMHKKEIGLANHRQLVYTSPDCISMIQIILGDTTEIYVHQRSLNLEKHATNDLMFIYDWAKRNLKYSKLFIHYNVGVPHRFF